MRASLPSTARRKVASSAKTAETVGSFVSAGPYKLAPDSYCFWWSYVTRLLTGGDAGGGRSAGAAGVAGGDGDCACSWRMRIIVLGVGWYSICPTASFAADENTSIAIFVPSGGGRTSINIPVRLPPVNGEKSLLSELDSRSGKADGLSLLQHCPFGCPINLYKEE